MTRKDIEEIKEKIPQTKDLRILNDWKITIYEEMNNIKFQMWEWKSKDSYRKTQELASSNYYEIDYEGEKKHKSQRIAYAKRAELMERINMRVGEIRRKMETDYYHMYHAITRRTLDQQTEKNIHEQALKESHNE